MNASVSGMIGSLPDDDQSQEFFGGSSAGCFINQVRRAVRQKLYLPEPGTSRPLGDVSAGQPRSGLHQSQLSLPDIVLPVRSKADQLLNIYWDIVYVLYPFVDKTETTLKYQSLFNGQTEHDQDHMFVCLLNVIFALSCQLGGARREASTRMYYQRAKELLDLWGTGSFQSVQVYLLLGQYFQSTNEPHQCWMMIGAAVRTAQSLGLHLPETTERIASLQRKQLVRTVWHGCVLMDRVVSMTYGRPPMVSAALAAAVPRPLAIDEDGLLQIDHEQVPRPGKPSIMDFFIQTLELYEILYDVLVDFSYSSSGGDLSLDESGSEPLGRSGISSTFSTIDIERRLVRWETRLPSHLTLGDPHHDTQPNDYFTRQAVILHQR